MKDYRSWAQGSSCYEQVKAMDDMIYSKLWAQGLIHAQLSILIKNIYKSYDLILA